MTVKQICKKINDKKLKIEIDRSGIYGITKGLITLEDDKKLWNSKRKLWKYLDNLTYSTRNNRTVIHIKNGDIENYYIGSITHIEDFKPKTEYGVELKHDKWIEKK